MSDAFKNIYFTEADNLERAAREEKRAKKEKPLHKWQQNKWIAIFYFPSAIIFLELVFHIYIFGISGMHLPLIILPALFFGFFMSFLWCIISKHHVRTVMFVCLTTFIYAVFFVHIIYYGVFKTFWAPFSMMGIGGQAFDYWGVIIRNFLLNLPCLLILAIPWVIYMFFVRRIFVHPYKLRFPFINLGIAVVIGAAFFTMVFLGSKGTLSPYDILFNNGTIADKMECFGVIPTSLSDAFGETAGGIVPGSNKGNSNKLHHTVVEETVDTETVSVSETESQIDRSPNILNIDFDKLIAEETDPNIVSMHEYFKNEISTNKNEYTGMFKGYNLIWISAEGFCKYALSPELTPTLYNMANNSGFILNNFYSPLYYGSTSGGEWANLTGMIPNGSGSVSMVESGKSGTNLPFAPGKVFSALGYKTIGFHNNDYTYYSRDKSMPNMNYEWIAEGTGYNSEKNENGKSLWPQSDLYMINQTFDYYGDASPFHAYYMTISGHAEYSFSGNMMSYKHKDVVQDLPYSDTAKAYIASQYELELFMNQLIADLKDKGVLDKTVIVLAADHIPYNYKEVCDEIAGHELESSIEWFKNNAIIWNSAMEPVHIDKYCSSIDLLPTVLNLFGVEYDSRLITGKDILSDSPQEVIFTSNYSFISDKCIYNGSNKEISLLSDEEITQDYLNEMTADINNKMKLSNLIIKYDYYDIIMKSLDK